MALTSQERQRRYEERICERDMKRLRVVLDSSVNAALERMVSERKMTKRSLVEELIRAEAQRTYR